MSIHPVFILLPVLPIFLMFLIALVIVIRAKKEDLPIITRALAPWWRRRR